MQGCRCGSVTGVAPVAQCCCCCWCCCCCCSFDSADSGSGATAAVFWRPQTACQPGYSSGASAQHEKPMDVDIWPLVDLMKRKAMFTTIFEAARLLEQGFEFRLHLMF